MMWVAAAALAGAGVTAGRGWAGAASRLGVAGECETAEEPGGRDRRKSVPVLRVFIVADCKKISLHLCRQYTYSVFMMIRAGAHH